MLQIEFKLILFVFLDRLIDWLIANDAILLLNDCMESLFVFF